MRRLLLGTKKSLHASRFVEYFQLLFSSTRRDDLSRVRRFPGSTRLRPQVAPAAGVLWHACEGGRRQPLELGVGRLVQSGGRLPRPAADSCRRSCLRPVAWHGALRQEINMDLSRARWLCWTEAWPGDQIGASFVARFYLAALRPARSDGLCSDRGLVWPTASLG